MLVFITQCIPIILSAPEYSEEDIAHSLLYAITDNLAQTVYMVAKMEGLEYACFCGTFVQDSDSIRSIIKQKIQGASFYLGVSNLYCDVPGSPCLSKTGPAVGPSFSIFGSLSLG